MYLLNVNFCDIKGDKRVYKRPITTQDSQYWPESFFKSYYEIFYLFFDTWHLCTEFYCGEFKGKIFYLIRHFINFQAHLLLYPREITTVKGHQCSFWEKFNNDCKSTKDQKACGRRFVKKETGESLNRMLFSMSQYSDNGNFKACTTDSFSMYHEVNEPI